MEGWDKKNENILRKNVSQDKIWSLFIYAFSDSCRKRNAYKFGLSKLISDNLFNVR